MAAAVQIVRSPGWLLSYKGVNITGAIEAGVLSVTYESVAGGASSSMEIEIEDRDKRWQGPWLPGRGDIVSLSIGYRGETLQPCGDFQIDEIELRLPPDRVHMRCIAAFITPSLRTPNTAGYENQNLMQIATTIAAKHGLSVVGAPQNLNVTYQRVTQKRETDLAFLRRLAVEHNYDFTVRGTKLVFYSRTQLEQAAPVTAIRRSDILKASFKSKTHQTYRSATISYFNPATKALIAQSATGETADGDALKLPTRVENGQQAAARSQAALHQRNMTQTTGSLTMPGSTLLAGGANITISGFGAFDGNYHIDKARHRLERSSGYTTEIEVRSV